MENYRQFFPITRHKTYLNHAAVAPLSLKVRKALRTYYKIRSEKKPGNWGQATQTASELKNMFAKLINTNSSDRIAFTQNTTHGLNIIASGLNWQADDEILIPEREFPANVYPFKNLERQGVKIKFLPADAGGITSQTLLSNITKKTKMLSISFVEFLSGYKHNMQALGQICHDKNILFIVDSIQGLGAIPFDVEKYKIDGLANGAHKWLMAPQGLGFLYITQQLQDKINQSHLGWTGLENFEDFLNYNRKPVQSAARYELGTLNFAGIIGAHAALKFLLEVGIENIYQNLIKITEHAIKGLNDLGFRLYTNPDKKYRSGIITFYPKNNSRDLFQTLIDKNIICSLRDGMIRIAPHFYNHKKDIDQVLNVCEDFLK
ncbi:MAG: aminotransferase class V-fold PLP-dependent enzyme [Candidatus Marinimicrobia bacterium]|nr:aminotransferase class V-fold PLP-dependent enzyme [Candidatus Neomarinimicrobiota bacterium]